MKMLARVALASAALAVVPVNAAEVGLLLDKQFGKAQAVTAGVAGKYESVSPTGFGIRAGVSILDLKVAELGLTATYHPKAEGDLEYSGLGKIGKFGTEYIAIGAQVDWKFLVNLHAGVDLRREKYTSDLGGLKESNSVTRPWVKAGIGFSVPTPIVSPFFRLEVAVAASKDDKTVDSYSVAVTDNTRKALAPEYQVGIYGGIRF